MLEASFSDGVWLIDLSALERDSEVWPAIAQGLLIPPLPGIKPRIELLERRSGPRPVAQSDVCWRSPASRHRFVSSGSRSRACA